MKILVADDSKTTLALIEESLKKLGHDMIPASNGLEAIELYKSEHPDLIILDVIMEVMDGFECAKRIREVNTDEWIPIIFLSGAVDDENIARGINAGGDDYLTKPFSEITLAAKIKAMQRIADMRDRLYRTTDKLRTLSSTDALTGIYNRFQFDKSIHEKIAHAKRHQKTLALLFVDLDNFKMVNDSLGHPGGDLLLKEVAQRLKACLRIDDFTARLGGDEFAIILSDLEDRSIAGDISQKIIQSLSCSYNIFGNDAHIGASVGIAYYPENGADTVNLIKCADIALYHAKESGRNNFQYFTEELKKKYFERTSLETALKDALEYNELFLNYQPIYDLASNNITRVEAFVAWKNPNFGVVPASVFIPLAEEMELIGEFGKWILRAGCEQASKWYAAGHQGFKLCINLSPRQLLQGTMPGFIKEVLQETKLPASFLELELTETSALIYSTHCEKILTEIHDMGISIALDDFGTGYSSLSHLKNLPISAIKIDRAFIQNLSDDSNDAKLVKSLIALGSNLGFEVICEGIETEEQLTFLRKNGCMQGQGYYFSVPLSSKELTDMLRSSSLVAR